MDVDQPKNDRQLKVNLAIMIEQNIMIEYKHMFLLCVGFC